MLFGEKTRMRRGEGTGFLRSRMTVPVQLKGDLYCAARAVAACVMLQVECSTEAGLALLHFFMDHMGAAATHHAIGQVLRSKKLTAFLETLSSQFDFPALSAIQMGQQNAGWSGTNVRRDACPGGYPEIVSGLDMHGICTHMYAIARVIPQRSSRQLVIWDPSPAFDSEEYVPYYGASNFSVLELVSVSKGWPIRVIHRTGQTTVTVAAACGTKRKRKQKKKKMQL